MLRYVHTHSYVIINNKKLRMYVGNTGNNCDSGDSNTGAIIGGIIGAAVVVIIIIIIIAIGCFVYYKRKGV